MSSHIEPTTQQHDASRERLGWYGSIPAANRESEHGLSKSEHCFRGSEHGLRESEHGALQSGSRRWAVQAILLVACLVVMGCSKNDTAGLVPLEGRLVMDGKPLQVAGADVGLGMVKLEFYPIENGTVGIDPRTTVCNANGEFRLAEGGITPGTYRLCVYQYDPYPQVDKLDGKFNRQNSKIDVTIDGTTKLDLDLAKLAEGAASKN